MRIVRKRIWLPMLAVGLVLAATGVFLSRDAWLPQASESTPAAEEQASTPASANDTIVVGELAQQNLSLSAKPLKAGSFWKTISVPGMVVDRPGVSDRQVVAPATGIVTKIFHVPGESVRPGEALFTLRLTSDSLHETQTDLLKTSQEIKLAEARLARLVAAGEGIPRVRIIEVESEITRLQVAEKSCRHELQLRGFTPEDLDNISGGTLVKEISVVAPPRQSMRDPSSVTLASASEPSSSEESLPSFELQELTVEAGQEVRAGESLCQLSDHEFLSIEGSAFRDETLLLERTIKEAWPVQIDFQEIQGADWPPIEQSFVIRHVANTIDPVTRTFKFRIPLENQSLVVRHGDQSQLLWRFRPGQRVRVNIPVEELTNVFVLPSDAVVEEGADVFVFTQNVNTFQRIPVHLVLRNRDEAVIANNGALKTYKKGDTQWTLAAVVRTAAAQLNRMTKAGSSDVPKGYHIHADGSLHKNEDEVK
jgi:membrane fusion protein, heavy metal efflux system